MNHLVLEMGLALSLIALAAALSSWLRFSVVPFLILIGMAVGPHAPFDLPPGEARVDQHAGATGLDDTHIPAGAGRENGDAHELRLAGAYFPVDPNPPPLRSLSGSSSVASKRARATGEITSWAMRSPRSIRIGSAPRFAATTLISPR